MPRTASLDIAFVAIAVVPATILAAQSPLKAAPQAALFLLLLVVLLTPLAPLQRARNKTVSYSLYALCRGCFFAASVITVSVGIFGTALSVFMFIFPPLTTVQGNTVAVMPIAQVLGALILAAAIGFWTCRVYFRWPRQLWKRMADARQGPP